MILKRTRRFSRVYLVFVWRFEQRSLNKPLVLSMRIETENKSVFWSSPSSNWFDLASTSLLLSSSNCDRSNSLNWSLNCSGWVRWWRFLSESLRTASNSLPLIEISVTGRLGFECVLRVLEEFWDFDLTAKREKFCLLFLWFFGDVFNSEWNLWWLDLFIADMCIALTNKLATPGSDPNWFGPCWILDLRTFLQFRILKGLTCNFWEGPDCKFGQKWLDCKFENV